MESICKNRSGYALSAVVVALTLCFSLQALAQSANGKSFPEKLPSSGKNDKESGRNEGSDLSILTRDASGKLGIPLPLDVKLSRLQGIYIESINVFGLPQDVTISDSVNVFSSSNNKRDVDISNWNLSKLQITQINARASSFTLAVAAIWTPETHEEFNVASGIINVSFSPDSPDRTAAVGRDEPDGPEQPLARPSSASSKSRAVPMRDTLTSDVMVPEVIVEPLGNSASTGRPMLSAIPAKERGAAVEDKSLPRAATTAQPTTQPDRLVERAKDLIRLGDISGARLLLERAQARNAPNATFLLAQTWDPDMLRAWKVRGLRADPELAKSLYARAASQQHSEGRQLTATGR